LERSVEFIFYTLDKEYLLQSNHTDNFRPNVKFPAFKYFALFAPILLLLIIVGFSIVHYRTESQIRSMIDEHSIRLHHISGSIGTYMSSAFNHLQSLYNETETENAINSNTPAALKLLENSLLSLAQRNPVYDQVRWIDEEGREKIRISRGKDGPYIESRQNLQNKSQRYYFKAASLLHPGELYASRIDLNVEHGELERPLKPMLRIATAVADTQGNRRGIIIINILMTPVFETVPYFEKAGKTGNYLLLNQNGDLLHGTIPLSTVKENDKSVTSLPTAYPIVWKSIAASETGHLDLSYGMWTWKRILSFDNLVGFELNTVEGKSDIDKPIHGEFSLIFVVKRPLSFLLDMRRNIRVSTFTGVFVVLVVYAISLYFYLSGNFRARRAELAASYARNHAANMVRLKEHEERFHHLVESSDVGLLVVDSEGKIEISNASIEKMLGYDKNELVGSKVEKLLPVDKQEEHSALRQAFMRDPRSRKMGEGRELEALRKDGTTIPVEIGLNPYSDQGRILVLVNVIDLSKR
jgi:PAS domain S-box-containing protein